MYEYEMHLPPIKKEGKQCELRGKIYKLASVIKVHLGAIKAQGLSASLGQKRAHLMKRTLGTLFEAF